MELCLLFTLLVNFNGAGEFFETFHSCHTLPAMAANTANNAQLIIITLYICVFDLWLPFTGRTSAV